MNALPELASAVQDYSHGIVRIRNPAAIKIKDICGNRENFNVFQRAAGGQGGAGWVAFYQCLFKVVVADKKRFLKDERDKQEKQKKVTTRPSTKGKESSDAEKRLAASISLVRWMVERSFHLLAKKPFMALFAHLTSLLVHDGSIFPPVAFDYPKALRTLLSYPPHLDCLDAANWKVLTNVCWSALLDDPIELGEDMEDEIEPIEDEDDEGSDGYPGSTKNGPTRIAASTKIELANLLPILLASNAAPLVPPLPARDHPFVEPSLGSVMLSKIHRFFNLHPTETSNHLAIVRSLNKVLGELELNCRNDMVSFGTKLLPQLVTLWETRNKALREQVVIALRILLPFVTHKATAETEANNAVGDALGRLADALTREAGSRTGIEPLDLNVVRLRLAHTKGSQKASHVFPFETRSVTAGFDFTHESALIWSMLELYAQACFCLYNICDIPSSSATPTQGRMKRRKVENTLDSLVAGVGHGTLNSRLLHLQVLLFLNDRYWDRLHTEAQASIRRKLLDQLNDDDPAIVSWAFVALAGIAMVQGDSKEEEKLQANLELLKSPGGLLQAQQGAAQDDWDKVWEYATRKIIIGPFSRAASHAAVACIQQGLVDRATRNRDIHGIVRNLELQGPTYPHDSVCTFLVESLSIVRSDMALYHLNLEKNILGWLQKWPAVDGSRGKARMDQQTAADVFGLLRDICRLQDSDLAQPSTSEMLPDCAIVDRQMNEWRTKPIRQLLLDARFPPTEQDSAAHNPGATDRALANGLNILAALSNAEDQPPHLVVMLLSKHLTTFCDDWKASGQHAASSGRIRKALDMVVVTFAFLAARTINELPVAPDCLHLAIHLLQLVSLSLSSTHHSLPGAQLAWAAFRPLIYTHVSQTPIWPILLKAGHQSGIRKHLHRVAVHNADDGTVIGDASLLPGEDRLERLQRSVWKDQAMSAALKELYPLCLSTLEANNLSPNAGYQAGPEVADDDFGEIRIAESDAMPQSQETLECRIATSALLASAIRYRLRGSMLTSSSEYPVRDSQVINAWLTADGARFVQLGNAICDALRDGLLRLNADAIDLIMAAFEEMVASYAYSRNDELCTLALTFLGHSAAIWLAPDAQSSDIPDRAIHLAKFLLAKISRGLIPSWRVRLAMVLFIDEYLDYQPTAELWTQLSEDDMEIEDPELADPWGPMGYMITALLDGDARVRLRAATSAAGVFYSVDFPVDRHQDFYFQALEKQPGQKEHWNSFISHLLWKLNCCIASARLRAATLFHLYEIPSSTSAINPYLQAGLQAVAERLHVKSISELIQPYTTIICQSQLKHSQRTLMQPYRLYGFPTKSAFAAHLQATAGSTILTVEGGSTFFKDACDASTTPLRSALARSLPGTAALLYGEACLVPSDAKSTVDNKIAGALSVLPGQANDFDALQWLGSNADLITAMLLSLLDLNFTNPELVAELGSSAGSRPDLFAELLLHDLSTDSTPALDPAISCTAILSAYNHIRTQHPVESTKVVFMTMSLIFEALHTTYLVTEERRNIRCLALIIALNPETYHDRVILEVFLRELIALVSRSNMPAVLFDMIQWGFAQIPKLTRDSKFISDILIQLGEERRSMVEREPSLVHLAEAIDNWISRQIPVWTKSSKIRHTLDIAMAFWPRQITNLFADWVDPAFGELRLIADMSKGKLGNPMTLCKRLADGFSSGDLPSNARVFADRTFWTIKRNLTRDGCEVEGALALLDMLHRVDGQVHAPSLTTIHQLAADVDLETFRKSLAAEPATMIRAILMSKLVTLTTSNSFHLRSISVKVLRILHPTVREFLDRKLLTGHEDRLALLLPLEPVSTSEKSDLKSLADDEMWIRRARLGPHWSSQLAVLLSGVLAADDRFYQAFRPLLEAEADIANRFLPWFVQAILSCGSAKRKEVAEARSRLLSSYFQAVMVTSTSAVEVVNTIVQVVLHLRQFRPAYRLGVLSYNEWLSIDPVVLAQASIRCGAFATALLFLEMANEEGVGKTGLDLFDNQVQSIMYEIYSNVEDPDGFYGIQTHDVKSALRRRLGHEKQTWRAFGLNGAAFETSSRRNGHSSTAMPLMQNLHEMGFDQVSSAILRATKGAEKDSGEPLLLELAWRTGDWELPLMAETASTSSGSFYSCLRAVHRDRDQQAARTAVENAIQDEIGRLGELGIERMAQIQATVSNLLCLREVALFLSPDTQTAIKEGDIGNAALARLSSLSQTMEFDLAERLCATRLSLLGAAREASSPGDIGDLLTSQSEAIIATQKACYLQLGRLARQEGKLQAAINAITAIQQLEDGDASPEAEDEFSHVLWAQKEHALAIQYVQEMSSGFDEVTGKGKSSIGGKDPVARQAVLKSRMAYWTSLAKMQPAGEIKTTFDEAYKLLTRTLKPHPDELGRLCHQYARFADQHHSTLLKSPELERLRANRERTQSQLDGVDVKPKSFKRQSTAGTSGQESRRQDALEDERALVELENELSSFVKTALRMYATSMAYSDEHDDSITRMVSLWLEHDHSKEINTAITGPLGRIPSRKFVFLGPQLAARLYKPKAATPFNSALNGLILRVSKDHPYHILYQIITAAAGSDEDEGKSTRRTSAVETEGRTPAAQEIISRLDATGTATQPSLARHAVQQMTVFTNAAIPWCHFKELKGSAGKVGHEYTIPQGSPMLALQNPKIPVATAPPPIDLECRYEKIPTLHRYRSKYKILGGLHRPKRMICFDSLGKEHYELFKGDDELRQDAVMEQVFEMTNKILVRDRQTKARNLRFRTYVVIPLPRRSGLMEFVGDSQAIGEWLKPAHEKYRKDIDHHPDVFRKELEKIQHNDYMHPDLPKRYSDLMKKFKPVMRHFFTERHKEPMAWFGMRLNYVRSVAVTSIVGHVLGIGDRHCSNILIDQLTGELVHIDFGIVFEDGRRLRIPEKVPFRLTNDIVDGLGLTGVDGTFRQCSQHTLRVLGESAELILTVLEVFKHDPLYAWTADSEKLKRAQGGDRIEHAQASSGKEKADRVLARIRQKLRPDLSVEYTVNQLIQEAKDVENLSRIFVGWQPWL